MIRAAISRYCCYLRLVLFYITLRYFFRRYAAAKMPDY